MGTKLVCGGVYQREVHGRKYHALCLSVMVTANGLKQGVLSVYGLAPERLDKGTDELNTWELVAAPAPLESAVKRRKAS